ncbi:MAG: glycosyltransferase [Planctomycetota bacterium]|jgi:hypothetical protein
MSTQSQHRAARRRKLLVFNCHEAWVSQLAVLGYQLDIIVGLKGQYKKTWDMQMRPIPPDSQLLTLSDALQSPDEYYCIIAHNVTDLLDVKLRPEPRLLVIHSTLEGRAFEERPRIPPSRMKETLHEYIDLVGAHVVAVSSLKGASWGFTDDIVPFWVDPGDYPPYKSTEARGLRICNFVQNRRSILLWDFHERAFAGLDISIVGHNPGLPGVSASRDWNHLKELLQSHRFYIHTANPQLEDGYNMATVEAMAAGMPIIGNKHPGSPVEHGVSGFLSDDPGELGTFARSLLQDRQLAVKMGEQARKTAMERFSKADFRQAFLQSIETARRKTHGRKVQL